MKVMYQILKLDTKNVYLKSADGHLKVLSRKDFDFPIVVDDKVTIYEENGMILVLPYKEEKILELDGEKSVKSDLLQGILDLFLETLAIHNNHLGNIKKVASQLVITIFMAWSLLGVIALNIFLLAESLVIFAWKLLVRGLKAIHLITNIKKWAAFANRKHQERAERKRQGSLEAKQIGSWEEDMTEAPAYVAKEAEPVVLEETSEEQKDSEKEPQSSEVAS